MVGRLDVIGAWSDDNENLIQVVYEDSSNGSIYIARVIGKTSHSVTVVDVEGVVSKITDAEFVELRGKNG